MDDWRDWEDIYDWREAPFSEEERLEIYDWRDAPFSEEGILERRDAPEGPLGNVLRHVELPSIGTRLRRKMRRLGLWRGCSCARGRPGWSAGTYERAGPRTGGMRLVLLGADSGGWAAGARAGSWATSSSRRALGAGHRRAAGATPAPHAQGNHPTLCATTAVGATLTASTRSAGPAPCPQRQQPQTRQRRKGGHGCDESGTSGACVPSLSHRGVPLMHRPARNHLVIFLLF